MSTKFWSPMVQVMTCQQSVAKPSHAGSGSIQSQNSKCSSIAIPELELELKQVELKTLELELQTVWMELKFYNCYCTAEMSLGSRLVVLLFVTKVLGTCTWLKKYLVYLMPSKHFECLYLQIWKSTCTWLNSSESTWPQPWLRPCSARQKIGPGCDFHYIMYMICCLSWPPPCALCTGGWWAMSKWGRTPAEVIPRGLTETMQS